MFNRDIRSEAASTGVKFWQIAEELGIADSSFSRKLRRELPDEEKQYILTIIHKLSKREAF